MGENVSKVLAFIDCSQGNFQLTKVEKMGVKHDRKRVLTKAMGVKGAAGSRLEEGGGTLTFEVYREEGPRPEIDYHDLFETGETFKIARQDARGRRLQFRGCQVEAPPEESQDSEGKAMDTVNIIFKRYSFVPTI